jgi:hypothetical protein
MNDQTGANLTLYSENETNWIKASLRILPDIKIMARFFLYSLYFYRKKKRFSFHIFPI